MVSRASAITRHEQSSSVSDLDFHLFLSKKYGKIETSFQKRSPHLWFAKQNLRSVFQRLLSKKPSVSANKLEHLDPQGSCRSVRVASLSFLSESQQPGWGLCLRPVDCQAFFFFFRKMYL